MGIEKEIKEAEDRLVELGRELTRTDGPRRHSNTILAEINGARLDLALARACRGSRAETEDPDAATTG